VSLPDNIGRYLPIRLLGEGRVRVFVARDPRLDREVAVKMVPARTSMGDKEGQRAASLSHPNLIALLDAGVDDPLGPFLVFEHLNSPSLRERLAEGPLSRTEVSRLARELGGAVTHIHEAGLVHRAVTPGGVRLAPSGAKLGDFDLLGPPASDADAHSDELALAATLYEALTGRADLSGQEAHLEPRVRFVFSRALRRDETPPFPTCRAFGEALAQALQDGLPRLTPPPDGAPLRMSTGLRATRKTQNMLAGGALAVILLLFFYGRHRDLDPSVSPKKPATDLHAGSSARPHERGKERTLPPGMLSDSGASDVAAWEHD
jgi:serine/threonine-protein kinase